jgi:hypothetical protein
LLEPQGELVDDLADMMAADESVAFPVDGRMTCDALRVAIATDYSWTRDCDFDRESAHARFWYVSEEKLEPRLGERFLEPGADLEQPLAVARDIVALLRALAEEPPSTPVADFLLRRPEWRHLVRRAQVVAEHPYSEIRGNLIDAEMRPVDLLRCKLAFFGARNFDPRSDRWLRIALFAGEPLIEDVAA